eukprot:TRINITY_DN5524_c0_g2_i6.p2 TRINITY_DN5524_c0_g2~~TRINITY_DN5524_c0_g2_i6.p2  ORF type:complete len:252 (-),score=42.34 TRINITY_DN5524_c0_g2_i6:324-1079(-)
MSNSKAAVIIPAVAGTGVALGALYSFFWWYEGEKCEKPEYTVEKVLLKTKGTFGLRTYNEMEVRKYAPYIVAEVEMKDMPSMEAASKEGFKTIAGYIFGKNKKKGDADKNEKMAMTAPVQMSMPESESEKISMTSPVQMTQADAASSSEGSAKTYKMSFVMPSKYDLETLPEPENESIKLRKVEEHLVAALTFYGSRPTQKTVDELSVKLRAAIAGANMKPVGDVMVYQYHPPFAPGFVRKNEILFRVESG